MSRRLAIGSAQDLVQAAGRASLTEREKNQLTTLLRTIIRTVED